jgi:catechol 2,3-dioxygenase-like lactoylglutathione lyase family enzyme
MIQKMSHATIWVLNQDEAKDFYVNKLGFELKNDHDMGNGFRWITVAPPAQPGFEIVLMSTKPGPMLDEETAAKLQDLVRNGKMGAGVFATADCYKTYEELKEKGVEFLKPPTEEFYATEALFKDNSGNWFSLGTEK